LVYPVGGLDGVDGEPSVLFHVVALVAVAEFRGSSRLVGWGIQIATDSDGMAVTVGSHSGRVEREAA